MLALTLLLAGAMGTALTAPEGANDSSIIRVEAPLRLGMELPGSTLEIVTCYSGGSSSTFGFPVGRIALTVHRRRRIVAELRRLRGSVRIPNGDAALRFVRLRTAFTTWDKWPGRHCEVEIVSKSDVREIPDFGLRRFSVPRDMYSGYMGVLTQVAYNQGGFAGPSVERTQNGFAVARWLFAVDYVSPIKKRVLHVREFVGPDGSYRRVVLSESSPPKLTQTSWDLAENE